MEYLAKDITKNFSDVEFLPKELWGKDPKQLIDPCLFEIVQFLRDKFGGITINNKYWGGQYNMSGLRPANATVGAPKSAHKKGKALDLKFNNDLIDPSGVYHYILQNQELFYKMGLRRMEKIEHTPTWLHIDTIDKGTQYINKIYTFNP